MGILALSADAWRCWASQGQRGSAGGLDDSGPRSTMFLAPSRPHACGWLGFSLVDFWAALKATPTTILPFWPRGRQGSLPAADRCQRGRWSGRSASAQGAVGLSVGRIGLIVGFPGFKVPCQRRMREKSEMVLPDLEHLPDASALRQKNTGRQAASSARHHSAHGTNFTLAFFRFSNQSR